MKRESLTRRRLLQAASVLPLVSAAANLARASEPAPEETLPKNAAEMLKLLKDGNKPASPKAASTPRPRGGRLA